MYFSLILLGVFLTNVPLSGGVCPVAPGVVEDFEDACRFGAIRVGTQCLLFNSSSSFYYEDGKRFCEEMEGGRLAPFHPQTIQAIMDTNLLSVDKAVNYLMDLREQESYFLSSNGQEVLINDSHWLAANGHPKEEVDCTYIYVPASVAPVMGAAACERLFPVICRSNSTQCVTNEVQVNDQCLWFKEKRVPFNEALSSCSEDGYHSFAYDRTTIDQLFQRTDLPTKGVESDTYWIQLRRTHVAPSGEVVTWENPLWEPSSSGITRQPFNDQLDCVALVPTSLFHMRSVACDGDVTAASPSGVVCQII